MSSNKKKTPVVLCDSSSSLRLVPYDESAHLDAYDAFMRDPQMLLDTKTEATTKDTWRAILSNNQTIESGVEQFMIDVLGDDGKRTCIGDVSSHDVPSCDVEEDEDDDDEEEEEEGAVSKEISICIFDKRYQRRGYALRGETVRDIRGAQMRRMVRRDGRQNEDNNNIGQTAFIFGQN